MSAVMHRSDHRTIDLYETLGTSPVADEAEIRSAYRRSALLAHPDKGGTTELFHHITFAFQVLSCSASRAAYDEQRHHAQCRHSKAQVSRDPPAVRRSVQKRKFSDDHPSRALERLCEALKQLQPHERREALQKLSMPIRSHLEVFMKHAKLKGKQSASLGVRTCMRTSLQKGVAAVRSIKLVKATKYRANIMCSSLRMYASLQKDIDTALDHQEVLIRLRSALTAANEGNPDFWKDHVLVLQTCKAVLQASDISEASLGLRVFIWMPATKWLGSRCVSSAAMSLALAVEVHARLLQAKATSWDAFRSEWLPVLRGRGLSETEAEQFADSARREATAEELARAVQGVEVALEAKMRKPIHD